MMRLFLVCAAAVVLLNVLVPRLITARELSRHPDSFFQTEYDEIETSPGSDDLFQLKENDSTMVANLRTIQAYTTLQTSSKNRRFRKQVCLLDQA